MHFAFFSLILLSIFTFVIAAGRRSTPTAPDPLEDPSAAWEFHKYWEGVHASYADHHKEQGTWAMAATRQFPKAERLSQKHFRASDDHRFQKVGHSIQAAIAENRLKGVENDKKRAQAQAVENDKKGEQAVIGNVVHGQMIVGG